METIKDIDIYKKTLLIRTDYNVPIIDGKIVDDSRISATSTTINHALEQSAKVVIISHLGRPNGMGNALLSLQKLIPHLKTMFSTKVHFATLLNAKKSIAQMHHGEILLLENIRFYPCEENNSGDFAHQISKLGDIYINEAFSCSHRSHASIVGVPQFLTSAYGVNLYNEIQNLQMLTNNNSDQILLISGGGKIETKIKIIQNMITQNKPYVTVTGGIIANSLLKAKGYNVGASISEETSPIDNIILPQDVLTAPNPHSDTFHICTTENVPKQEMILDIGPATIMHYKKLLSNSKMVIWNGPLGFCENPVFAKGTVQIANYISYLTKCNKIKSLIGGGDTISCVDKKNNIFTHVSTGGGAFLKWLQDYTLVGLTALEVN